MYTLQNIKDSYHRELASGAIPRQPFSEYLTKYFVKVYDVRGEHIGWDDNSMMS